MINLNFVHPVSIIPKKAWLHNAVVILWDIPFDLEDDLTYTRKRTEICLKLKSATLFTKYSGVYTSASLS